MGTGGGTEAGVCWQEPGPVANPQKASLCVSSHVAAASSIATQQGSENSSLSIYFIKCCPWCLNRLRAQSMPFKTIKRHKTELVTASSSLKSAIKCQLEEPQLTLCRSPAGLCPWEGQGVLLLQPRFKLLAHQARVLPPPSFRLSPLSCDDSAQA